MPAVGNNNIVSIWPAANRHHFQQRTVHCNVTVVVCTHLVPRPALPTSPTHCCGSSSSCSPSARIRPRPGPSPCLRAFHLCTQTSPSPPRPRHRTRAPPGMSALYVQRENTNYQSTNPSDLSDIAEKRAGASHPPLRPMTDPPAKPPHTVFQWSSFSRRLAEASLTNW